jgi:hypothetical protein
LVAVVPEAERVVDVEVEVVVVVVRVVDPP